MLLNQPEVDSVSLTLGNTLIIHNMTYRLTRIVNDSADSHNSMTRSTSGTVTCNMCSFFQRAINILNHNGIGVLRARIRQLLGYVMMLKATVGLTHMCVCMCVYVCDKYPSISSHHLQQHHVLIIIIIINIIITLRDVTII